MKVHTGIQAGQSLGSTSECADLLSQCQTQLQVLLPPEPVEHKLYLPIVRY